MGRWPKGEDEWREDYRKESTSVSLPRYLLRDLRAHGCISKALTEILETHKEAIGEGTYLEIMTRREQRLTLEVEILLKEKLPKLLSSIVAEVIDNYINKTEDEKSTDNTGESP